MDDQNYSDDELARYFADADARRDDPEADELADFFDSPDAAGTVAATTAASVTARTESDPGASGDGATDDAELAAFFASPDYSGDGASTLVLPPPPPQTPRSAKRRRTLRALSVVMGIVTLGVLAGLGVVAYFWPQLPSLEQIENPKNLLATVVLTADDTELARYYKDENRTWVPLDSISTNVTAALLATEDRRFYDHWGVDAIALGAIVKDAITQGDFRGASTVTMQLARNLYREDVNYVVGERSVIRKIKEILTAIRIERIYTKDEILEAYLNTVPFLYNAYGIQSASETYFAKAASDLNPQEAAVLVGMLAANDYYDPAKGRPEDAVIFESTNENSIRRRNQVLANMAGEGVLEGDLAELQASPITLNFEPYSHENNIAPHFAEVLRIWFREWAERNNYDPYADGLVIRTTIDSRMQQLATEAVQEQMDQLQQTVDRSWGSSSDPFGYWWRRNTAVVNEYIADTERYQQLRREGVAREDAIARLRQDGTYMDSLRAVRTRVEAGLVALDPRSGQVKAWVGGRDYVADQYDHVGTARRQPGSTFKLFAYATAVAEGYGPSAPVSNGPFRWGDWNPQNSGGGYSGYVPLNQALASSLNVVAARITKHFGPEKIKQTAEDMGIRSPIEPVRSIALGTNDVNLLELAAAYSTVASGGIYHGPTMGEEKPADPAVPPHIVLAVDRIEDRYGNVIEDFTPAGREVLNPSVAYTMQSMMRGAIRSGTARSLGGRFPATRSLDLAGKTGTTQENADGWFMAFHPHLVVGSWTGFNDRRIKFRTTALGQGARTALPNVGAFFQKLQSDSTVALDTDAEFEEPENYSAGRAARIGGGATWSGERGTRRRSSNRGSSESAEERSAARGMLDDYNARDRQRSGGGGNSGGQPPAAATPPPQGGTSERGGRIGW